MSRPVREGRRRSTLTRPCANKPQHANEGQATRAALRSRVKLTWTGPGGCDGGSDVNVRAPDRKEQILGRPADVDLCC